MGAVSQAATIIAQNSAEIKQFRARYQGEERCSFEA